MQLDSSIITGISTLLAVGITLYFTTKRDKNKFIQDLKLKEYIDVETFYINLVASIEKTKRYTKHGENYKELINENSLISAKANLIASTSINEQLSRVSILLFDWTTNYRQSLPTKIGDTGFGVISNMDIRYKDKADEIYPILNIEIGKLIEMIKAELNRQKKILNK